MKKRFLYAAILIVAAVFVYTACEKDDDDTNIASIIVTPADTAIAHKKGVIQYTCVINYNSGQSIDGTTHVLWSSSDVNTAIISNDEGTKGLATTTGSGITIITASLEGVSGAATLEVLGVRAQAINDYVNNYLGSELTSALGWTGAVAGCVAGDIDIDAHNKVIQRINYFRSMCGLSDNVSLNASQTAPCQECALMMKANNALSHNPPPSWLCYTADGAYAAGGSNIAWGIHSVNAVTGYIEDPGANNTAVGHRAWILLPELLSMGDGSTDNTNSIMWKDNLGTIPATKEFVAYPPEGYIPSTLVFPRWHFQMFEAGFGSATVEMQDQNGNNINLNIIDRLSGYKPDNRIVWEPTGINTSSATDVTYTVTVSGITNAPQSSYTYDVIIFKPPTAKTAYEKIKDQKIPFEIR